MPGQFIDFPRLKTEVSILQVVQMLGLKTRGTNAQFRGECTACKTGGDRALAIHTDKNCYFCFSAQKGGDAIALVAHIRGVPPRTAAEEIMRHFGINHSPNTSTSPGKAPSEPAGAREGSEQGFAPLPYLEFAHEAVEALGLDASVAEAIGAGYAPKGLMRGLIAFPVRLPDGTLCGYIGVSEAKLPNKWHGIEPEATNVVPIGKRSA